MAGSKSKREMVRLVKAIKRKRQLKKASPKSFKKPADSNSQQESAE